MKIDIKIIIRFLKEKRIYQFTINGIKKCNIYKSDSNIMKFIENNFFFGGSCEAFFVLIWYWNTGNFDWNKDGFDFAHKYSNDFELYLDKIRKS